MLCFVFSPVVCWVVNAFVLANRKHWSVPLIIASAIGYVSVVAGAQARELELERAIEQFERNGQGETPEARQARQEWASDTGRTFAPILGLPLTVIWTTMNFVVFWFVGWSFRTNFHSVFNRTESSLPAEATESSPTLERESGNPYQPPR